MSDLTKLPKRAIQQARDYLYFENNKYPKDRMVEIPRDQWPKRTEDSKANPIAVWRNKYFLVQVYNEGSRTRITVCRTMIDASGNYQEDIQWQQLQDVKRMIGFGDRDAVEIFPNEKDVVNVANMRHLWLLEPDELPFIWRAKE